MTTADEAPIVVGVDGSPASLAALRWAATEAERQHRIVKAMMVWQSEPAISGALPAMVQPYQDPAVIVREHAKALEAAITAALGEGEHQDLQRVLVHGWPPEELASASAGAGLLVIGSHGHNRLAEAVLGSVSSYCVRHATCPVVVIPAAAVPRPRSSHEEEQHAPLTPGPLY